MQGQHSVILTQHLLIFPTLPEVGFSLELGRGSRLSQVSPFMTTLYAPAHCLPPPPPPTDTPALATLIPPSLLLYASSEPPPPPPPTYFSFLFYSVPFLAVDSRFFHFRFSWPPASKVHYQQTPHIYTHTHGHSASTTTTTSTTPTTTNNK